jgi:hypothetical protein
VQDPQVVSLPTLVWFERAENIYGILPHSLYFSANEALVFGGVGCDKEAGVVPVFSTARANEVELLGQMIEGRPEILDGVAQDHGNFSRDGIDFGHVVDWLACLRIALDAHSVGICSTEGAERVVQVSDVLMGSFDFVRYKRKSFIGIHG